MSTISSITAQIQKLINEANATTGAVDATLTDAHKTLIDGYGEGGSSQQSSFFIKFDTSSFSGFKTFNLELTPGVSIA